MAIHRYLREDKEDNIRQPEQKLVTMENPPKPPGRAFLNALVMHHRQRSAEDALIRMWEQLRTLSRPRASIRPRNSIVNVTRSHLPLGINGLTENAVVDTGAQENAMAESLAKRLRLPIHRAGKEAHEFVNAVGKRITAIGYTHVPCSFQDRSQQTVTSRFWVFPKLVVPLVVGRKFLQSTETLTRFKHRLKDVVLSAGVPSRVLHMELPRWRINCTIDSLTTLANPDTGSDLDLMSLSFVRENGLKLNQVQPGKRHIQFADGTMKRLNGVVSVPFSIGQGQARCRPREFHVLDGLTSEVLLGNNTLKETDAFNSYGHEFVDLEEYDNNCDLHFIRWVHRNGKGDYLDASFQEFQFSPVSPDTTLSPAPPFKSSKYNLNFLRLKRRPRQQANVLTIAESEARSQRYLQFKDLSEHRRRTREEAHITKLDPHQRPPAEAAERDRQGQYDRDRADFVARHDAAVALLNSGTNSAGIPTSTLVAGTNP